jgi:hypothetical protein
MIKIIVYFKTRTWPGDFLNKRERERERERSRRHTLRTDKHRKID